MTKNQRFADEHSAKGRAIGHQPPHYVDGDRTRQAPKARRNRLRGTPKTHAPAALLRRQRHHRPNSRNREHAVKEAKGDNPRCQRQTRRRKSGHRDKVKCGGRAEKPRNHSRVEQPDFQTCRR